MDSMFLEMELKIELILILFLTPTKIDRNAPVSNINWFEPSSAESP